MRNSYGASKMSRLHWGWTSIKSTLTRRWKGWTASTGRRGRCVFRPLTWKTCGVELVFRGHTEVWPNLARCIRIGRISFVVSTFCWRQAVPSDNIAHGNEAKSFFEVQFNRYAVVVELRQYVAMSLHLPDIQEVATLNTQRRARKPQG